MNRLRVFFHGRPCGVLEKMDSPSTAYCFTYDEGYAGAPISLTLPVQINPLIFPQFPPFFEGLFQGEIEDDNYMAHLAIKGQDMIGAITVQQLKETA